MLFMKSAALESNPEQPCTWPFALQRKQEQAGDFRPQPTPFSTLVNRVDIT
jgi:hypothetical protein